MVIESAEGRRKLAERRYGMKYCTVDNVDIKEKQSCIVFDKDAAIPHDCMVLTRLLQQRKTHEDCEHYKEAEKTVFEKLAEINYNSRGVPTVIISCVDGRWSAFFRNPRGFENPRIEEYTVEAACQKLLDYYNAIK